MTTGREIQIREDVFLTPDEGTFRSQMHAINKFQKLVHELMVEGQDYDVVPGTGTKPTLLKPGGEKIIKILGLSDTYEFEERTEDFEKGFFRYLVKCTLTMMANGCKVTEGLGECNSYETKYRWREAKRICPTCGKETIIKGKEEYGGGWLCFKKTGGCGARFQYNDPQIQNQQMGRVPNEDVCDLVNTMVKMAKKRAMIDAALSAGRLSNLFTQDLEDGSHETTRVEATRVEPQPEPTTSETPNSEPAQPVTPPTPKSKPESKASKPDEKLEITNIGNLYQVCREKWNLTTAQIHQIPDVPARSEIVNPMKTFLIIKAYMEKKN